MMSEIYEELIPFVNKAEFPLFPLQITEKINKIGFNGFYIKDFGGPGLSTLESGAMTYELSKKDASIATFVLVHNSLGCTTIDKLGNEE